MAQGSAFDRLCRSLALSPANVAQLLHVSERTVHNWRSGTHRVPYMAFKLVRVMGFLELPFAGWQGWAFVGGKLVSPEGHRFVGSDSSWWSLLVRQARSFGAVYERMSHLERELARCGSSRVGGCPSAPALAAERLIRVEQRFALEGPEIPKRSPSPMVITGITHPSCNPSEVHDGAA